LANLEDVNGLLPRRFLAVVDLSEVEHVSLDNPAPGTSLVFDDTAIAVLFAILDSRRPAEKHAGL
jgi:hypothetical protein